MEEIVSKFGKWCDNVFVTVGRDFMTVTDDGNLEIRGKGWTRWKKGDHPGTDRVRICKIECVASARKIAEMIAEMMYGKLDKDNKRYNVKCNRR